MKTRWLEFHREWFMRFEDILHRARIGPMWLKDPAIAEIVFDSLVRRDGPVFRLEAFCIMSNHVHAVFKPLLNDRSLTELRGSNPLRYESKDAPLGVIMKSLKGYTARKANELLGRSGSFWEEESYDHEVRDNEEFDRIVMYVLKNPVKAGLVQDWRDWPWSWRRRSDLV